MAVVLPPRSNISAAGHPWATDEAVERRVGSRSCASASGVALGVSEANVRCALCSQPSPNALRAGALWCDRAATTQARQGWVSRLGRGAIGCGGAFPWAWGHEAGSDPPRHPQTPCFLACVIHFVRFFLQILLFALAFWPFVWGPTRMLEVWTCENLEATGLAATT